MNKRFEMYVRDYGYSADNNNQMLNQLFSNSKPATKISIDLDHSCGDYESVMMLRTSVNNPSMQIVRDNFKVIDSTDTVVADIPSENITDCVFKNHSTDLVEYKIMMKNNCLYTLTVNFERR